MIVCRDRRGTSGEGLPSVFSNGKATLGYEVNVWAGEGMGRIDVRGDTAPPRTGARGGMRTGEGNTPNNTGVKGEMWQ